MRPPASRHWLIVVALVALSVGFAGYRWSPWQESPCRAWDLISSAAAAGVYGAVYDRFDPPSQQRMSPTCGGSPSAATCSAGWTAGSRPDPTTALTVNGRLVFAACVKTGRGLRLRVEAREAEWLGLFEGSKAQVGMRGGRCGTGRRRPWPRLCEVLCGKCGGDTCRHGLYGGGRPAGDSLQDLV